MEVELFKNVIAEIAHYDWAPVFEEGYCRCGRDPQIGDERKLWISTPKLSEICVPWKVLDILEREDLEKIASGCDEVKVLAVHCKNNHRTGDFLSAPGESEYYYFKLCELSFAPGASVKGPSWLPYESVWNWHSYVKA